MTTWCEDHGVSEPCPGCRADELAAGGARAEALRSQGVPHDRVARILAEHGVDRDVRKAAAGDDD
jgi:hypothetical protein